MVVPHSPERTPCVTVVATWFWISRVFCTTSRSASLRITSRCWSIWKRRSAAWLRIASCCDASWSASASRCSCMASRSMPNRSWRSRRRSSSRPVRSSPWPKPTLSPSLMPWPMPSLIPRPMPSLIPWPMPTASRRGRACGAGRTDGRAAESGTGGRGGTRCWAGTAVALQSSATHITRNIIVRPPSRRRPRAAPRRSESSASRRARRARRL